MSNITVCARFRPLSSKEKKDSRDNICISSLNSESFVFKEEKEECTFSFDKVFYEESMQADVYEFLALPIVKDAVKGVNGTIITYGQTGAGKTYSVEGTSILECDEQKKGLLPRVVDGLFECIKSADELTKYTVKLSMVEIYMEKVRDLLDLTKDNIQIKENKMQEILLSGVTEITISDPEGALQSLSVRQSCLITLSYSTTTTLLIRLGHLMWTEMNVGSSRSHCVYILTVQLESTTDKRVKTGKVILVDLAGSEKVEKSGAEGKVLEEAKTINKSLSALGNVINALTCGPSARSSHIPFRDSKLTRILQDALGGNSRTVLLCCCSPSPSNALETLSTLRFGMRAKHIKASPLVSRREDRHAKKHEDITLTKDESCDRILNKLRERLDDEDVRLLEELFILEGLFFDANSVEDVESDYQDVTSWTISSLQQTVEELIYTFEELKDKNKALKARLAYAERFDAMSKKNEDNAGVLFKMSGIISLLFSWAGSFFPLKMPS
ncbi:CENTROMERE PROTEIN E [Salix viminalis]|uniref:Kinesin-like protein n=1 Tax=Salix viminalis TaxID=40686 RepID=A0A9Q0UW50_SALVM|nr:CENTROMERE PROTEIN E [Salix viminalis]